MTLNRAKRFAVLGALLALSVPPAYGHEMRPAFLELREGEDSTWSMTWKVPARGPDMRLALDVRLPEGSEWTTLPARDYTGDAFIDRGTFTRSGGLDGEEIYIEGLLSTFTDAMVQIHRRDGSMQSARLEPSAPSLVIEARPDPAQLPRLYFEFGVDYLKGGWDHFALVFGLLVLAGSAGRFARAFLAMALAAAVTAGLALGGFVDVSPRWTEVMIALGLVALGVAIVRRLSSTTALRPEAAGGEAAPVLAGAVLGLVHGLAFVDGFQAVGVGLTTRVEAVAFLGAIAVGLTLAALVGLGLMRLLPKPEPKAGSSPSRQPALAPPPVQRVAAYALGILGVVCTLQRW